MNRTSSKAIKGKTLFELVYGKKPDLSGLREWGSNVWVHQSNSDKLEGCGRKGQWIGYDDKSNGSRIYFPDTGAIKVERNFHFISEDYSGLEGEQIPVYKPQSDMPKIQTPSAIVDLPSSLPQPLATTNDTTNNINKPTISDEPIRRSHRLRNPSQKARNILEGKAISLAEEMDWTEVQCLIADTEKIESLEPRSLKEAKKRRDWNLWKQAMHEELTMLSNAGTWELVEPPENVNIVGSKWVYKAKKDAARNIVRYKARLVAQVAKLASIQTVLAIAAARDFEIHQIDIKGAYLNGKLNQNEVIYMQQPPGSIDPKQPFSVCCLKKTLYGLKQSGRRWYQRLCEILKDNLGFTRCEVDHSVFFKISTNDTTIILVYVNDCVVSANSSDWN